MPKTYRELERPVLPGSLRQGACGKGMSAQSNVCIGIMCVRGVTVIDCGVAYMTPFPESVQLST